MFALWLIRIAYAGLLITAAGCLFALWRRGGSDLLRLAPWIAAASFSLGGLAAVTASSDWNPFSIVGLFAPFWMLTVWAGAFSRMVVRGRASGDAAGRALLAALCSLVLAPLAALAAWMLWPVGLAVTAVLLGVKRPWETEGPPAGRTDAAA